MNDAPRSRIALECPCGRRLTVRADLAGTKGRCPSCGKLLEVPQPGTPPMGIGVGHGGQSGRAAEASSGTGVLPARPRGQAAGATPRDASGATCSICQTTVGEGEPACGCQTCDLPYHRECWDEYGGCAAYGCANAPRVEAKKPEDTRKECPFCGERIAAKALRCPSCRERFEDARPVDREEYIAKLAAEPGQRATRNKSLAFLSASLLPCLGPVILVAGAMWLANDRRQLDQVGGVYTVMVGAATSIGGLYTVLLMLFIGGLVSQ